MRQPEAECHDAAASVIVWPAFSLSRAKGQHILRRAVDDENDAARLGLGQPGRV
jgi:hypothetical protein